MLMATSTVFQVSADNLRMYIIGPALLKTKLHMLQDKLDWGSKSVYPEAMEPRVHFQKYINKEYADTIIHFRV